MSNVIFDGLDATIHLHLHIGEELKNVFFCSLHGGLANAPEMDMEESYKGTSTIVLQFLLAFA